GEGGGGGGEARKTNLSPGPGHWAGPPPQLQLPADRPRPEAQSFRGARHSRTLPQALSEGIKALRRRLEATLFMTLLAVFKVLVYRYTGQQDLVIGTNVANRNRSETEALIGFFVNLLPLRTSLSGNPSFEELLNRVRMVALGAYTYQDVPFETISKPLKLRRSAGYPPLVQVTFNLAKVSTSAAGLSGLSLSSLNADVQTSRFDLVLTMIEREEGLTATVTYNPDLFNGDTIINMLGH